MKVIVNVLLLSLISFAHADVIKPTLAEVSIYEQHIELELHTNIEALITGIGTQYRDSTKAPNASEYDELRKLSASALKATFTEFEPTFLERIDLSINGVSLELSQTNIAIEDVGYTQRPRASRITYRAPYNKIGELSWLFDEIYGDNAFRFRFVEKDEYTWQTWQYLSAGTPIQIDLQKFQPQSRWDTFLQFITIGFKHVIPLGLDHILFVITMVLGVMSMYRALLYVSSFTLAHTLTLGLSTYDIVALSPEIIEPIIALSIVIMALDKLIFHMRSSYNGLLIFAFGLLHGLGFALMLREFIDKHILVSLAGFNIGVELAQVVVVIVIMLIFFMIPSERIRIWLTRIIAFGIALIGLQMFLERIL